MTQGSKHTGVAGPELVRLLARLAQLGGQAGVTPSDTAFDVQLSQWLGWTDAMALAAGLDVAAAAPSPAVSPAPGDAWLAQAARVRSSLAGAISRHGQSAVKRPRVLVDVRASMRAAGISSTDDPADFSVQRQHIRQQQDSMESAVSSLRTGLRAALASGSAATARLAAVDSVIEQALVGPMHSLTSAVPRLLERYFRHLQSSPSKATALETPAASDARPAWLNTYLKEQEKVLLAELDFRFQPIEGLMAALQSATHDAPVAAFEPT